MKNILIALILLPLYAHAENVSKQELIGNWQCKFTFPLVGDRILYESIQLKDGKQFTAQGDFTYFLPKESQNATFSFESDGKWEFYNFELKLFYQPFEIIPLDDFSKRFLDDLESEYIKPSLLKGTRRVYYFLENLTAEEMILGDDYDSWQCVRK
ncbi:hypothetical protein KP803_11230 [Vibrio sp. ZSDE26]|uniref:Uncharacterized protein n=1 Tax=Vibrio amylolyticus TaxID=2847292 RepID=A0A9X2BHC8_9VIBR|nr:hypothetical protein [Vibrio amylolyticus]MCK6263841.1 hypothetical protein [Vibrio amylolyticus]